ncbi:Dephospho-CoA kinase [Planctomycetes bacterium CA13]|uniref:Dephospho-CoA kinase n=1 Tax=Novipirellula herctigrandis TaxID=2527986 RepID=A0A5C5YZ83_9BACT|nr:Dephospho-CoA kinase [Planctomycetes bacterium CA13]
MIVIGIVGAPAGGKSTVAGYLEELGATWINADLVARDVLQSPEIQAKLISHFGPEITGSDGQIERTALASVVFGDDEPSRTALHYLESVIHPPTREEITERLATAERSGVKVAILDVPLLFESKWDRSCDEIWFVDAPWAHRLRRAKQRGWDESELRKRESNQLSTDEKRRLSSCVIENGSGLTDLRRIVRSHWDKLTHLGNNGAAAPSIDTHCRTIADRN